jgi:hypothetical protein
MTESISIKGEQNSVNKWDINCGTLQLKTGDPDYAAENETLPVDMP